MTDTTVSCIGRRSFRHKCDVAVAGKLCSKIGGNANVCYIIVKYVSPAYWNQKIALLMLGTMLSRL